MLKGEVLLVGPRPIVQVDSTDHREWLPILLSVRSGLTGASAVSGCNRISYADSAGIELTYAHAWTLTAT